MTGIVYDIFLDEIRMQDGSVNAITPHAFTGTNLSPGDGLKNRTLAVAGTIFQVVVDGFTLHPTSQYIVSGGVITFLNNLFDSSLITVWVIS